MSSFLGYFFGASSGSETATTDTVDDNLIRTNWVAVVDGQLGEEPGAVDVSDILDDGVLEQPTLTREEEQALAEALASELEQASSQVPQDGHDQNSASQQHDMRQVLRAVCENGLPSSDAAKKPSQQRSQRPGVRAQKKKEKRAVKQQRRAQFQATISQRRAEQRRFK